MKHFVVLCLVLLVALTVQGRHHYDEDEFWKRFDIEKRCAGENAACGNGVKCCHSMACSKAPPDFKQKCFLY